ncbi:acyl carrier protein [Campylobacter sp. 2352 PW]|uniref:acyl carrier protein n=1 Tax=Campylobacter sp. 2352 PW TaxID=2735750 RepID=UPI00301C2CD7|nr:acyl carrier protein [Campylobacter sp. 2352 PW]
MLKEIEFFFTNIEKPEINKEMKNLVTDNIIDSLDIMMLVNEIEKYYNIPLKSEFILIENFESYEAIERMIKKAIDHGK